VSRQLAAYRVGAAIAHALPTAWAAGTGQAVGALMGSLPDYDGKRAVAASHMARAYGRPLGRSESRRMVAQVFANYGRYWAESLRLPYRSDADIVAGVQVTGWELLERALAAGTGAIVAAPHLGGWEWGARYLIAQGIGVTVAVEPLEPPDVFAWFAEFRRRLGMEVVAVGPHATATILQALKAGRVVCLLSDRLVGDVSGAEVKFFGAGALLPAGPVTLALRSGAPLLSAAIYFGRAADAHELVFRPPLTLPETGRFRDRVQAGTELLAGELEALISRAPTQWHILQPNWPDDPPLRTARQWAGLAGGALAPAGGA
jgi:KDO2-lipid IV(A) lauroyltransferase